MAEIPAVVKEAQKRFKLAQEAEKDFRNDALDDLKFRFGDQWPEEYKRVRRLDNRPCLTINRLPQFLRQVTNEQRQNRVGIEVSPVDDGGDDETAEIIQGIVRHIEYDSNADSAYDTAFEMAVTIGFGFWEIVREYETPFTTNQVIKIKRIKNPFMVYFDPNCIEPDYSDAEYAFKIISYTKDEYRRDYPDTELADLDDWTSVGDADRDWIGADVVRVAEYYYIEKTKDTVVRITNKKGETRTTLKSKLPDDLPKGVKVEDLRETEVPVVKWCKINAVEVLEKADCPGRWIPIVPVLGDDADIDGKRHLEGMVRNAKDPQRMYNFWASAETEAIALAPRAPFIGAEGQFEGHPEWQQANSRNFAYLEYKPKTIGNEVVGPPQRNVQEPAVAAITQARMQSSDDLKATTGIYDASLGARSNEQTGKAILARQQQGQVSNFHYTDNLSRAIRQSGRIIISWIPTVYDTARVMRIVGEDGTADTIKVNQQFLEKGIPKIYDLTTGTYDVVVSSGPGYNTKRQEAVASMLSLVQAEPAIFAVIGDLMVASMDWPNKQEIADRLKKALPPQLQDNEDQPPVPPQAQQKIQQQGQMIEQLTAHVNDMTDQIKSKQLELDSKERIAALQSETQLAINNSRLTSDQAIQGLVTEMSHIHELMAQQQSQQQMAQQQQSQAAQQAHEADQNTQAQAATADQAAQAQQAQQAQAAQ